MIDKLSINIIGLICVFLDDLSAKSLNLVNKNVSRKVTHYMLNNLIYKCNESILKNIGYQHNIKYSFLNRLFKCFSMQSSKKEVLLDNSDSANELLNKETQKEKFKRDYFKYVKHINIDDMKLLKLFDNDIKTLICTGVQSFIQRSLNHCNDKLKTIKKLKIIYKNTILFPSNIDLIYFQNLKELELHYFDGKIGSLPFNGKYITKIIIYA